MDEFESILAAFETADRFISDAIADLHKASDALRSAGGTIRALAAFGDHHDDYGAAYDDDDH